MGKIVAHHGEIQGPKTKQNSNQREQSGLRPIDHGLPEEYITTEYQDEPDPMNNHHRCGGGNRGLKAVWGLT